jgi:DNA processing protein
LIGSAPKDRLVAILTLLTVPGVGRGRYWKLIRHFHTPESILKASIPELEKVADIGRKVASAITGEADPVNAGRIADKIAELGWQVLLADTPGYPRALREIADPPPILFAQGQPLSDDERLLAIVGTRHASETGRRFTTYLAQKLAADGIGVVSGMAEGIDTAAHSGALEGGGKTIAVWGTSLDIVYPATNKGLAERIRSQGTVLSEYLPGTGPDKSTFPDRNRIISGLSVGVIVVEAGRKSGALITADLAIQQGRDLFAVPGPPGVERCIGTNELLKRGARVVTTVDDIYEELPRLKGQVSAQRFQAVENLTDTELKMIRLLADGPKQIDQMAREVSLPVSQLLEFMLALEMKGMVQELAGKRFVLAE